MEEIVVNSDDLSTMCRLCLSTDVGVLDIFWFSPKMRKKLADVIMTCAPVLITKRDEMPNFICQLCHSQLENIHQFQMQIVQSEKTLRSYLNQLHSSDRQIKAECFIEESSEDNLMRITNVDIPIKRKSLEQYDMFDMPVSCNENAANKIKEEISLKYEVGDESVDDNSLIVSKSTADTIETSKDNSSEISCEDTKIGFGHKSGNFTRLRPEDEKIIFAEDEERNKNPLENSDRHKWLHTGRKPYLCDICNKCFSQSSRLINHKRIHTGEKPFQCDFCDRCFSQRCHLNIHKRAHTGEKPFQCDTCNRCFSRSDLLKIHKRTHTGEKPYKCGICDKSFTQPTTLSRHKQTHSSEKSN